MILVCCASSANKMSSARAPGATSNQDQTAHTRIAELDEAIRTELATLNLPYPAIQPPACSQPPCAEPMAAPVKPTADPTCKPGPSDKCKDSCRFADSICDNAGKICEIAAQLGGNDPYANEKCGTGKASCETAGSACCSCQL